MLKLPFREEVPITRKLLKSVSAACQQYQDCMKSQKSKEQKKKGFEQPLILNKSLKDSAETESVVKTIWRFGYFVAIIRR